MGMPSGVGIVDTMIGFPQEGDAIYDFIRKQTKDQESKEMRFPVEYMFKNVPHDLPTDDPVSVTLREMDRFGIEKGMIGCAGESAPFCAKNSPQGRSRPYFATRRLSAASSARSSASRPSACDFSSWISRCSVSM